MYLPGILICLCSYVTYWHYVLATLYPVFVQVICSLMNLFHVIFKLTTGHCEFLVQLLSTSFSAVEVIWHIIRSLSCKCLFAWTDIKRGMYMKNLECQIHQLAKEKQNLSLQTWPSLCYEASCEHPYWLWKYAISERKLPTWMVWAWVFNMGMAFVNNFYKSPYAILS